MTYQNGGRKGYFHWRCRCWCRCWCTADFFFYFFKSAVERNRNSVSSHPLLMIRILSQDCCSSPLSSSLSSSVLLLFLPFQWVTTLHCKTLLLFYQCIATTKLPPLSHSKYGRLRIKNLKLYLPQLRPRLANYSKSNMYGHHNEKSLILFNRYCVEHKTVGMLIFFPIMHCSWIIHAYSSTGIDKNQIRYYSYKLLKAQGHFRDNVV